MIKAIFKVFLECCPFSLIYYFVFYFPRFLLRRIPDKNDHCAFTRGSRGEVMTFFEKNKVLGVEPNRVLNILEGI
jgi:hypothetical protein